MKAMLHPKIENALNAQLARESAASSNYLAMAVWCDQQSLDGCARFFYRQADEERMHMMKILHYLIECNAAAEVPGLPKPAAAFQSVQQVFHSALEQEQAVTRSINELVELAQECSDHSTQHFLQWYVAEQIEEEAQAKNILDKINLIGDDKGGLYLFDRDIQQITVTSSIGTIK